MERYRSLWKLHAALRPKSFKKAALLLGLHDVTLHSARHYAATAAIASGIDVRTAAELLGHSNPNLTLATYGHAVAGMKEKAVTAIAGRLADAQARRAAGENRRS